MEAIHETEWVSRKLFTFGDGECFGELPLLLQVPSGSFRALLTSRPEFADTVAQEVARRNDVLRSYEGCLRQRGLLDDVDVNQPLQWFGERLRPALAVRSLLATGESEQGTGS